MWVFHDVTLPTNGVTTPSRLRIYIEFIRSISIYFDLCDQIDSGFSTLPTSKSISTLPTGNGISTSQLGDGNAPFIWDISTSYLEGTVDFTTR